MQDIKQPTIDELQASMNNARQMRSETIADMFRSVYAFGDDLARDPFADAFNTPESHMARTTD